MWNGVELVEFKLVLWTDVDVGALVFGAITVSGGREDYEALVIVQVNVNITRLVGLPVIHFPLCSSSYPSILTS